MAHSHVRRLEALRRARIAERRSDGRWPILRDFLDEASAYGRRRRGTARLASALDLEAPVASRGATWLDRQLVAREPVELADRGFGLEVKAPLGRRSQVLVQRWLAIETDEGVVYRQGLINALTQNETRQAGEAYARPHHWKYHPVEPCEAISGRYVDKLQLDSGTFAVVQDQLSISLIAWRAAIEQHLGREVTARIERGMGVSWDLGRGRPRAQPVMWPTPIARLKRREICSSSPKWC